MGELDELLRQAAARKRTVTLTLTNPTEREERRLRLLAQTVNSNKSYGIKRARVEER